MFNIELHMLKISNDNNKGVRHEGFSIEYRCHMFIGETLSQNNKKTSNRLLTLTPTLLPDHTLSIERVVIIPPAGTIGRIRRGITCTSQQT